MPRLAILLLLGTLPEAHAVTPAELRAGLAASSGWEDVTTRTMDDGTPIRVRHKVVAGQDCLEGTTTAALAPDALLAAATDISSQPRWSSWELPASVKLSSGSTFDYYQVLDNPAPVADRYWFLRGTVGGSGGVRSFSWDMVDAAALWPAALAEVRERFPSAVMPTVNIGDWTFTPKGASTEVRYRICTDAGGDIPRWVGEYAATRTLPTNLADLVKEVRRRSGAR